MEGVNDKSASNFYLGKKVAYIYKAQKSVSGSKFRVVWGKVMRAHGTNGVVRAKFSTNLPVSFNIIYDTYVNVYSVYIDFMAFWIAFILLVDFNIELLHFY